MLVLLCFGVWSFGWILFSFVYIAPTDNKSHINALYEVHYSVVDSRSQLTVIGSPQQGLCSEGPRCPQEVEESLVQGVGAVGPVQFMVETG